MQKSKEYSTARILLSQKIDDLPEYSDPETFLENQTQAQHDLLAQLNREIERLSRKVHQQRLLSALIALERSQMLPHLHPIWHRVMNQIRDEVGVHRVVAVISAEDEQQVRFLEHKWRYDFGFKNNPYPNVNTVGGPIRSFTPHSNWKGERIQVLSSQYKGHLGRMIGMDSTFELMIELDSGIQLFSSEMWWVHRHDHCEAICPICGESFFAADTSKALEELRSTLRAVREEIIQCQKN